MHIADGSTLVYVDGREYDGIFPVWVWTQIPGTTEWMGGSPATPCGWTQRGTTALVGGASTGEMTGGCGTLRVLALG